MSARLFILAMLLGIVSQTRAQDVASIEKVPLPEGPLLVQAASFARWQITYSSSNSTVPASKAAFSPGSPPPANASATPPHLVALISVTKTDKIYHREVHYGDSKDLNEWWVDGVQITQQKGSVGYVLSLGQGFDMFYIDYSSSDFPELKWLDDSSYIGIQNLDGIKCLVFKKYIPKTPNYILESLPPNALTDAMKDTIEATAWVNVTTHLPMQFVTGLQKQTYTFLEAPSRSLTMPDDGAREIAAWEKMKAEMARPGPKP